MQEITFGLIVVGMLIAMRLLALHPGVRAAAGRAMRRLGERVVDWLRQEPEIDPLADDLAKALRREKLRADVRRLERLLATDESMSACRQLGNRIAYDWLLRELDKSNRDISRSRSAGDGFADSWVDDLERPGAGNGHPGLRQERRTPSAPRRSRSSRSAGDADRGRRKFTTHRSVSFVPVAARGPRRPA